MVEGYDAGDLVSVKTPKKIWEGRILDSYDSDVFLLKLSSGYNIGINKNNILNVNLIEKNEKLKKEKFKLEKKANLPNIVLIVTGGTISSRLDPKTGGVLFNDVDEILNLAPKISEIANIVKIDKPFMKWSEDMSILDWKKLGVVVEKYLNDEDIDGIIITHGTDFLHYTGSALSFMIKDLNKPVALTYSQKSIDRGSTDAALNLICAAKFAASDLAEVVLVGHENLNDLTCLALPGTKVRKMHASRRDAFKGINDSAIARISKDNFEILKEFNLKDKSKKVKIDNKFSDKVAVIKITPGQDPDILNYYASKGYKGIVLEVAGLGQLPGKDGKYNWLPVLKKVIKEGIVIFAVSQTIYGKLNPNVYSKGRDVLNTGVVYLKDMLSETAFVKLSWVLGHKAWFYDDEKIKEKMITNLRNEFNEKIGFESDDNCRE